MSFDPPSIAAPAIYTRTGPEEPDSSTALQTQLKLCLDQAGMLGLTIPADRIFTDAGCTCTSLKRPALSRLRQAVAAGQVDCVLIARLDRLSCSVADTVALVRQEWAGITLWSVGEGFHTGAPPGPLILGVLASYAEGGRAETRRRLEEGRRRRFAEGQRAGGDPPFGYVRGDGSGSMVVVPAQAELIRRIFQLYLQGHGFAKIAAQLNAGGCPTGRGNPWTDKTVRDVACNAVYAGKVKCGGQSGPGRHAPIIDEATFAAVQELRRSRERVGGRSVGSPFLLAGLVHCKGCGQLFHTQPANESKRYRKDGRLYLTRNQAYYQCGGRLKQGAGFCRCGQIQQDVLESHVVERLRARFGDRVAAETDSGDWFGRAAGQAAQWDVLPHDVRKQLARYLIDRIFVWKTSQGKGRFRQEPAIEVDIVWNRSELALPAGDAAVPAEGGRDDDPGQRARFVDRR